MAGRRGLDLNDVSLHETMGGDMFYTRRRYLCIPGGGAVALIEMSASNCAREQSLKLGLRTMACGVVVRKQEQVILL